MKFAFSTVGCPDYQWSDVYSMAKDLGYDGIEVRGLGREFSTFNMQPFSEGEVGLTVKKLADLRLSIPCLSSGCVLKFADKREENLAQLKDYIHLAQKLNCPYVRVMGDYGAAPDGDVDDEVVASQLRELIPLAEECGVTLLLETNGAYADTARLRDLLTDLASDNVAALWDMHHPYRFMHESPEQTLQNLGTYIKHVHIKDSVIQDGRLVYRLMGDGDLPIADMMMALRSINYEGYVSLEWVRYWNRDMYDAGVVFPQYIHYMEAFMDKPVVDRKLYTAHTGKGQYVWPHNKLIDLTFPQVLDRMVQEFPDQICFDYSELDYKRTYSQFRDDVDTFARALIAMGVKRGDHVAIWATNVPQWYITFWATTKIGAVLVTVNTAYKIHEAEYLLRQSDTHTLVMIDGYKDSDYVGIIKELCPELAGHDPKRPLHTHRLPFLRNVITCESAQEGCYSWESAHGARRGSAGSGSAAARAAACDKHDVCNMQYTSGTTGFPKGVMLTHYNVVNNGKAIGDCMDLSTADQHDDPGAHVPLLRHGAGDDRLHDPRHDDEPDHGLLASQGPQVHQPKSRSPAFHGVPTMFIAMLEHPDFAHTDFSHMRTGIMAGSPCPIKVMQDVVTKMHMSEICITYGQTEAVPCHHDVQDHRLRWRCASTPSAARSSAWNARSSIRKPERNCPITRTASSSPEATTS